MHSDTTGTYLWNRVHNLNFGNGDIYCEKVFGSGLKTSEKARTQKIQIKLRADGNNSQLSFIVPFLVNDSGGIKPALAG